MEKIKKSFVGKSWGSEQWFGDKGKRLFINAGHKTSWHKHVSKEEIIFVESGKMTLRYVDVKIKQKLLEGGMTERQMWNVASELELNPGDAVLIKVGDLHQLIADAYQDVVLFEFGQIFGDDSVRFIGGA